MSQEGVPSGRHFSKVGRGEGVEKEERGEGWRRGAVVRRQGQGKGAVVRYVRAWGEVGVIGVQGTGMRLTQYFQGAVKEKELTLVNKYDKSRN